MKMRNEQGFTLVEALMALVLLTTALAPMLYVAVNSNRVAISIENNVVAANLAQEGIEIVRNIRDENWINGRAFDFGISGGTYAVEWDTTALVAGIPNYNNFMNLNSGIYDYSGGTSSIFKRRIIITTISTNEFKIESVIDWNEKRGPKTINVEARFYNWQ